MASGYSSLNSIPKPLPQIPTKFGTRQPVTIALRTKIDDIQGETKIYHPVQGRWNSNSRTHQAFQREKQISDSCHMSHTLPTQTAHTPCTHTHYTTYMHDTHTTHPQHTHTSHRHHTPHIHPHTPHTPHIHTMHTSYTGYTHTVLRVTHTAYTHHTHITYRSHTDSARTIHEVRRGLQRLLLGITFRTTFRPHLG